MKLSSNTRSPQSKSLVQILVSLIFLAMGLSSSCALAWGHIDILNNPVWVESHLVLPTIRNKEIKYCLTIDPKRLPEFQMRSMKLQVESALRTWLIPVQKAGLIGDIKITRVKCNTNEYNLKVDMGPESKHPEYGAYQVEKNENDRLFSFVRINTEYEWEGFKYIDTYKLLKLESIQDLKGMLAGFEALRELDVTEFATANTVARNQLFWTTQRVFIHEFGHAFGLCDTIPTQRQNCDPNFLTEQDKDSVMSNSMYMTLTKDDEEGIIALFKRFLVK
jgi:hypothetical protein